jgi:tellurite resistance protein TehA-like permease
MSSTPVCPIPCFPCRNQVLQEAAVPLRPNWVATLGLIFYILNISLFILNCILITIRFHLRPGSFLQSFTDQFESLFVPSVIVSVGLIFITTCQYGIPHAGPWLLQIMQVMFWVYIGVCAFASVGMYVLLWSTQ